MITYRLLNIDEWERLSSILESKFIPSPAASAAAVAENESGDIIGVLFLQLAMHMEPLVLSSPKVNFERLYSTLYNAVQEQKGLRFYCFSDQEIVNRMAEHVGMTRLPFNAVYEQEVS